MTNIYDLVVLCQANTDALIATGIYLDQLNAAATATDEMANLLAIVNGAKAEQNLSKTIRDKACTHFKELVDDVREAGK